MGLKIIKIVALVFGILLISFLARKRLKQEWLDFKSDRKRWLYWKWKNWGEPILIAVVLALFIRTFFLQAFKIPTSSMYPTLQRGDRIFVDKVTYRFKEPERGDIIVFRYPLDRKKDFVKRLIAFGGETVEIKEGNVYINGNIIEEPQIIRKIFYYNRMDWSYGKEGEKVLVPEDSFFVLGDNSAQSSDSRNWGFVPCKDLIGKAFLIWWPPKHIKIIK